MLIKQWDSRSVLGVPCHKQPLICKPLVCLVFGVCVPTIYLAPGLLAFLGAESNSQIPVLTPNRKHQSPCSPQTSAMLYRLSPDLVPQNRVMPEHTLIKAPDDSICALCRYFGSSGKHHLRQRLSPRTHVDCCCILFLLALGGLGLGCRFTAQP